MKNVLLLGVGLSFLSSCALIADKKDPGWEYAPQMYVSDAYEPYSQVEDHSINKDGKNMREPVAGTIARSGVGYDNTRLELMNNYPIGKDSLEYAAKVLKNPLEVNDKNLEKGAYFYNSYCSPCHGKEGKGDGLVGQKYGGVPNYQASYIVNQPSGHIYHVITKGKGRMWGHGSQIRPEERWQIVMYVNKLRGYTGE
ncbi:MAG: cytochrome C [Sphingobacteriaceae bacterium]|nr:cytochrome C [Sphingobacteriaceae bacterium]